MTGVQTCALPIYIWQYASIASFAGAITGILVGSSILPYIVNIAYSSNFTLPKVIISFYPSYIIQSLVASLLCTVGAALVVLKEELRENPSNLMRVKAPKLGKKILLERIRPIWRRLNFNQKVTFRNLFRYKQRMLMTIFGISGCMAMLAALLSSNTTIASYFIIFPNCKLDSDEFDFSRDIPATSEDEEYEKYLKSLDNYEDGLNVYQESVTFSKENMSKQSAMMYVPENIYKLNDFILLNDRASGVTYKLSDDGVIINEKLAKLLKVSAGGYITLTDADNNNHKVKVDNIVENYLMQQLLLS